MNLKLYRFKLPFRVPLHTAKGVIDKRSGLLVQITTESSRYWGEVSPLPGFSSTSLDECLNWFTMHNSVFISNLMVANKSIYDNSSLENVLNKVTSREVAFFPEDTPPEIIFAFDTILFQLIVSGRSNPETLENYTIRVNAAASSLAVAKNHIQNGFKVIKLKVGIDWAREFEMIRTLNHDHPQVSLRLDANESWSMDQASTYLQQLAVYNIEYIEQPVNSEDLMQYGKELSNFGVKIAADESARSLLQIQNLIDYQSVDVFILKPPMLGGFKATKDACEKIQSNGRKVIFTSSLDSDLNLSMAAFLALNWGNTDDFHGFSTGSLFEINVRPDSSVITESSFIINSEWIINPDLYLDKSDLEQLL